jgi:hypothetical protein
MDTVRISYANNPDLKSIFSGKNPGDEVELTVKFQVKSVGESEVTGSLSDVEAPEEDMPSEMMGEKPEVSASNPASMEINASAD